MRHLFFPILLLFLHLVSAAQTQEEIEFDLLMSDGIHLVSEGKLDAALEKYEEARKLMPESHFPLYEIGFVHLKRENYREAIKIYRRCLKYDDVTDQTYQMLGNAYSLSGNKKRAIRTYEAGIKKFPNSGRLYLERGNVEAMSENYNDAIGFWENGIVAEPDFPSNYYRLAHLYSFTENLIWTMIYGEIFMHLEYNSARTANMSRMLYNVYQDVINFNSDSSVAVIVSDNVWYLNPDKEFRFPLHIVLGMDLSTVLATEAIDGPREVDIAMLNRMRSNFIQLWFQNENYTRYPNVLFDYHKKVADLGLMEVYTYWIFSEGNPVEFDAWLEKNEVRFKDFAEWFLKNPIGVNENNRFLRTENY